MLQNSAERSRRRGALMLLNLFLVFSLFPLSASGQSANAALAGRALDPNSAAIGGARITLKREDGSFERTVTTDEMGAFRFVNLPPGDYTLSATGRGFTANLQGITLVAGQSQNVTFILQLASLAEEVVVSAMRILGEPEVASRIPGSVDVLDARTLENGRFHNTSEALRRVPGLNVRDEEGFGLRPNIGIRGLNPTRSSRVLLLEDGIPLTYAPYGDNSSYYHPPIDRYESVEIMRGAGQILYGPVTVGGVINYITPNPPATPAGSVTLTGGNRDYFNGQANYGWTWRNTGFLLNYMRKQGEGARENLRFGLHDFNVKTVTTISPRQALTLRFNYYGEDSNITYSGLTEDEFRANPRQNPFRNDYFYGDRYGASATHAFVFNSDAILTTNLYGAFFRRHWWRQSSNSGQRPNRLGPDADCRGMIDLNSTCGNEGRLRQYYTFGVEPRLRLNHRLFGLRNETELGFRAHYEIQDRRQENGDLPTARSGVVVEDNERRNQAYSAFISNRFIWHNLTVTPGVRVEQINYRRTNRLANGGLGVTGRTSLTQVVPGIGISYNPTHRLTIFAGAHRGFAPPRTEDIINNTTGGSIDLDPELSWNYEAGLRTSPHAGLRLEATFFRMDYENQIVPASLAGGVGTTLTNGGETLHQGFEFGARVDTGLLAGSRHNFYARTAYTYLPHARFDSVRFSSVGGFANTSVMGNRLPYAPEHLLNAAFGYSHPRGVDAFLEAVHVGDQFSDDLNTVAPTANGQRGLISAYTIWNATANYHVEAWRATLFFTVKNLADRTYIADRTRGIMPGPPRLAQAGIKFRF